MYSPASKKRDARTQTHTLAHTDMRTPPTSYYTDGTHFGFHDWIPTPQPQPHARTVGSDRHVVAASTVTVPGAVLCCLCAPSCVLCDTFNKSHRRWAVLSDTSSRPVTDDALVYRCLVSSSLFLPFPSRGTWPRPCTWRFPSPRQTPPAVSSPRGAGDQPPFLPLAAPVVAPRVTRAPIHRDTVRLWRDLGPTWAEGSTPECHDERTRTISDVHPLQNGGKREKACCMYTGTVTVAVVVLSSFFRLARNLRCRGALVL